LDRAAGVAQNSTTTTAPPAPQPFPSPPPQLGAYHALLIGVEEYDHEGVRDLTHPLADAERIRGILTERYTFSSVNVQLLRNPRRADILDTLDGLKSRLGSRDNLLIFYAGHGYWDEAEHRGSWLPRDAEPGRTSTWIANGDIVAKIRAIPTRHTLLVSDACFSGSILDDMRELSFGPTKAIAEIYKSPSRKAMSSGTRKEAVPDESAFVKYLVKRLRENDTDFLTAEDLYGSLRQAVINESPTRQKPEFGTIRQAGDEGGGDFIFVLKVRN